MCSEIRPNALLDELMLENVKVDETSTLAQQSLGRGDLEMAAKLNTYFVVRRGFGSEGHGEAIEYGPYKAASADDAETMLLNDLRNEFGGLAESKLNDCGISGKSLKNAKKLCGAV